MGRYTVQLGMLKRFLGIVALFIPVALAGCAAADKNVRLDYQPTVNAVGGKGELYVAITAEKSPLAGRSDVEWVLGEVKDSDGKRTGKVLSAMAPKDLVADAFIQELKAAGYKVSVVPALPANVAKGLDFTGITLTVDEVEGLAMAQAKGALRVKVSVWKGGAKLKQLDYEEASSISALRADSKVLDKTLHETVVSCTRRAIPDILQALEY
ncbi:MAG: hypothetical protein M0T70_16650 [Geobacteraceae bacterium]|nr:hypothetical protein [Geobacteraceae bacterium]